jgi:hypothetical protein
VIARFRRRRPSRGQRIAALEETCRRLSALQKYEHSRADLMEIVLYGRPSEREAAGYGGPKSARIQERKRRIERLGLRLVRGAR